MISLVKLKTKGMFADRDPKDPDFELWQKITDFMDGKHAWVIESAAKDGRYVFLCMQDDETDKEVHWLMEQDSYTGCFVGVRDRFDDVWEKGEYERELCWYLEPEHLEFVYEVKGL